MLYTCSFACIFEIHETKLIMSDICNGHLAEVSLESFAGMYSLFSYVKQSALAFKLQKFSNKIYLNLFGVTNYNLLQDSCSNIYIFDVSNRAFLFSWSGTGS